MHIGDENKMERGGDFGIGIAIAAAASDYTLGIFGNANVMSLMWCDPAGSEAVKKEAKAGKMGEESGEMIEIDRQIGNSLLFPVGYPLFPL